MTTSAACAPIRDVLSCERVPAICTWLRTAPFFLRHTREVERRRRFAFQMGSHGKNRADCHDARPTYARHNDAGVIDQRFVDWLRQRQPGLPLRFQTFDGIGIGPLQLSVVQDHEARAEAFQTRRVFVTCGLIHNALATEFGFQRLDGNAVRLGGTVTAAFTHSRIDDDTFWRVNHLPTLAATPLLGCTGLIVDHNRNTLLYAQLALNGIELVAMPHGSESWLRESAQGAEWLFCLT